MEDLLRVGIISSTHGIRGEVKVYPTTDDLNRFQELGQALLDTGEGLVHLEVEGVKFFKNMAILKFKGYDSIDDIEKYKGKDLLVTRENAVKLEPGEYFIGDILGLLVVTDQGQKLGTLVDVLKTGANDVYMVQAPDGGQVLLPVIKECILDISPQEGLVRVHLMPGLVD